MANWYVSAGLGASAPRLSQCDYSCCGSFFRTGSVGRSPEFKVSAARCGDAWCCDCACVCVIVCSRAACEPRPLDISGSQDLAESQEL